MGTSIGIPAIRKDFHSYPIGLLNRFFRNQYLDVAKRCVIVASLAATSGLLTACDTIGHVLSDPKFYEELNRQTTELPRRSTQTRTVRPSPANHLSPAKSAATGSETGVAYAAMNHCVHATSKWSGDFFNVGFRSSCRETVRAYVCISTPGHPASCTRSRKPFSGFGVMTPGSSSSVNYLVGRDIQRSAKGRSIQISYAACVDPGYPYADGSNFRCGSPF